jgi:hypothetical protein
MPGLAPEGAGGLRKRRRGRERVLDDCADMGVILSWWKLWDGIEDEGFFKSLILRFAALFLKGAF